MENVHWLEMVRADFPILQAKRNDRPLVYLDNACTTLVPLPVIEAMNQYYTDYPVCGGSRSRYWLAEEVSRRIEGDAENHIQGSRQDIQEFIHARDSKEIIFSGNTTHSINLVALGTRFHSGDTVLLSDKEHNSNLVPWLRLQKQGLIQVDHCESGPEGTFDLDVLEQKLKLNRVRLVSLVYTSNLTGETLPVEEAIRLAHENGALVLLDAAQAAPHQSIDVRQLDVDFLAFSIHKMCGPKGVGVLYGKNELLGQKSNPEDDPESAIEPCLLGGGTILDSTYQSYKLLEPPERFEPGVQNYAGQMAAGTAVKYLQKVGMERIQAQEKALNSFLTEQLLNSYGDTGWFRILGPQDAGRRNGILTFEVKRPNAFGIAEDLAEKSNIMVRDGAFCVHSYFNHELGQNWISPRLPSDHRMIYRISLYFYNTREECRIFLDTLASVFEERSYI